MILQNKSIKCIDCGASFVFSTVEQAYYVSRGSTNQPERCPSCRQAKKERPAPEDPGNNTAAHRSKTPMFSANCARCGKRTEVPFEPRNHKAIYCSSCYDAIRANR